LIRKFLSPFATGLLFLAPVLLTLILLNWLSGYLIAALGPNTPLGQALGAAGMFFTPSPLAAFWAGLGMAAIQAATCGSGYSSLDVCRWARGFKRRVLRGR
jgi:uncharacterized membrane protein